MYEKGGIGTDRANKTKRIRIFGFAWVLLALLVAAAAVWWGLSEYDRLLSGVTACVDGTIRQKEPDKAAAYPAQPDSEPASVIGPGTAPGSRVALTFVGLSDDEDVNASVVRIIREHRLKTSFALSAAEAAEHPETLRELLDIGAEIISSGLAGEQNLHRKSPEEMVHTMTKSRESISTGIGRQVDLLYCGNSILTWDLLCAARRSGYQAVAEPETHHILDETSFPPLPDLDAFVSGLCADTILAISLRGPVQSIQYEPPIDIQKPAVDKQPSPILRQTAEVSAFPIKIQRLIQSLEAHELQTEYVSLLPRTDGGILLKARAADPNAAPAIVYRSILSPEPMMGIGIQGLPTPEEMDATLSKLSELDYVPTVFVTSQEAAARQEDVRRLSDAGCTIGAAVPPVLLAESSREIVFDCLCETTRCLTAFPGYCRLVLTTQSPDRQTDLALRTAARQLGMLAVQPESGASPAPGSLCLLPDWSSLPDFRESAPDLTILDIASAIRASGQIPALSPAAHTTLRSRNGGALADTQELVYTTCRQVGFAFYGMTNPSAAEDVSQCLQAHSAAATFFVTLNELTKNQETIERLLSAGNELGIYYGTSPDYPQRFDAVTDYLNSWKTYARWRYGTDSSLIFLRLDTAETETLEAIQANGCRIIRSAIHPFKNIPEDTARSGAVSALETIASLRVKRGSFLFFRLDHFQTDRYAQEGTSMIAAMLDGFYQNHIDRLAYHSGKTGLIEDESRFSVTPLGALLAAPEQYTLCTTPQEKIRGDRNVLTNLATDADRFQLIRQRYYGNVTVADTRKLPGFTYGEAAALNKQGTFTQDPVLFLTFDDWGTEQSLNPLLYVLEKLGVKATFFIRTGYVDDHPNLLRAIAQQGHQIAAHTDSHFPLAKDLDATGNHTASLSREEAAALRKDLVKCYEKLHLYTGNVTVDGKPALSGMFRPPTLAVSKAGLSQVLDVGYDYSISGDFSTGDYEASSLDDMLDRLTRCAIGDGEYTYVHNGSVIVMHMQESAGFTAQALDEMIPKWRSRGFRFARIDDYLKAQ